MVGTPYQSYLESGKNNSTFLIDTITPVTCITASDCYVKYEGMGGFTIDCASKYYTIADSSTQVAGYPDYPITSLKVNENANFTGQMWTDNICLDESIPATCATQAGFFYVQRENAN